MPSDTVISVEHLSKCYRLGSIGTGTFRGDLQRWWAKLRGKPDPHLKIGEKDHGNRDGETIWALKDVSFEVKEGEVLGIIGKNGAGKSTLLKILSRVTAPTSGEVRIKGRIASLLEVGTGFHPELTGRENIFLNGAILGMTKAEVKRKFDEIVDFSGVEQFIDTPVKRYSSGMYVRLAFAVAAHLDPEILIVDEVLAVGDAEFQKKCLGKMKDVASHGRTVLFVSHNMTSIARLCSRAIIIHAGTVTSDSSDVKGIIDTYAQEMTDKHAYCDKWQCNSERSTNEYVKPLRMYFSNEHGQEISGTVTNGAAVMLNIEVYIEQADLSLVLGYAIFDQYDNLLYWSYCNDTPNIHLVQGYQHMYTYIPTQLLNEGIYRIEVCGGLHDVRWIYQPGGDNPHIYLRVQFAQQRSPYWTKRRETLIAPNICWHKLPVE